MKNAKRTLLIGFVWGLFFFLWWLDGFLYENWKFSLFSYKAWAYLFGEFLNGWVISSKSDWIFLLTLIVAIPVFLYGWRLLLKVQWKKIFSDIVTQCSVSWRKASAPKKVVKITAKKSHKKVRPRPLNRIGRSEDDTLKSNSSKKTAKTDNAVRPVPALKEPPSFSAMAEKAGGRDFSTTPQMPAFMQDESDGNAFSDSDHTSEESFENLFMNETVPPLNEDIQAVLIKNGYKVIKDVVLGTLPVDYIGVGADYIVICLSDTQKGDWLADEERFNGEDPLWFSESSHRVSPIFQLTGAVSILSQKLMRKGFQQIIVPLFIERAGVIINADDMAEIWKTSGVVVCRTDVGGPETLPSVSASVPLSTGELSVNDFNVIRSLF